MPDSGAQWNVSLFIRECCCGEWIYLSTGDTIVNGKKYQKLWKKGSTHIYTSDGKCDNTTPLLSKSDEYVGAYWEDTILKKVYFIPKSSTQDTLLFDFNLKVGDTLRTFITANMPFKVLKLDSALIGSVYRKTWSIENPSKDATMIEGVGSNFGLLEELLRPIEGRSFLNCLSDSNEIRYPGYKPSSSCPMLTNSILPIQSPLLFQVYPNPSNGTISIKTSEDYSIIKIYNSLGQIVINSDTNSDYSISHLHKGIYYLKLLNEKINATQKLILE